MELLKQWKAAQKEFKKLTGKSVPSAEFTKAFSTTTKVESALKECDKYNGTSDPPKVKRAHDQLEKEAAAYITKLDKLKEKEKKEDHAALAKALLFLRRTLQASVEQAYATYEDCESFVRNHNLGGGGVGGTRESASVLEDLKVCERGIKTALSSAKAACAKLDAATAKMNSSSSPDVSKFAKFYSGVTEKELKTLKERLNTLAAIRTMLQTKHITDPKDYIKILEGLGKGNIGTADDFTKRVTDFKSTVKSLEKVQFVAPAIYKR
jgi:hypothetical protein